MAHVRRGVCGWAAGNKQMVTHRSAPSSNPLLQMDLKVSKGRGLCVLKTNDAYMPELAY